MTSNQVNSLKNNYQIIVFPDNIFTFYLFAISKNCPISLTYAFAIDSQQSFFIK
jgi:hypothetical protein